MKKSLWLGGIAMLALTACQENVVEETTSTAYQNNSAVYQVTGGCSETYTLYAGQTIASGTLEVSNDADSIYVTYTTTNGWELTETQLYVGDLAGLPATKNGNPKVGNFPYKTNHTTGTTSMSYAVAIDDNIDCYVVAAHASVQLVQGGVVVQTETAWSEGTNLTTRGSWATYSTYCLMDCCEIATVSYDLYGGQTILVGSIDVTNDDNNVYITYNTTGGWTLAETHLYVGDLAGLPTNGANTPIPGQFPNAGTHSGATSYTYTIPLANLNDCFIIAAHASVEFGNSTSGTTQQETAWSIGTPFPNTNRWGWYSDYCVQTCE